MIDPVSVPKRSLKLRFFDVVAAVCSARRCRDLIGAIGRQGCAGIILVPELTSSHLLGLAAIDYFGRVLAHLLNCFRRRDFYVNCTSTVSRYDRQ